jgi:hypothetical protein
MPPQRLPLIRLLLLSSLCQGAQFSITPKTPPVVYENSTVRFTASRPVDWSLAPGSKGSIDPDGTYHAPAHIQVKQSLAGCQVLPNNHILNTRIDTLPVNPKSERWMHSRLTNGRLRYAPSFPVNTITSHTPLEKMAFAYTPEANGPFHILPPADFKMEAGYYVEPFGGIDRHSIMVETDTCGFQEMYNFYPKGTNTYNNCPECTSQSGIRYSGASYTLRLATDAASLPLAPLSLHRDEVLAGAINHALRFTLDGAFTQAAHIWPAMGEGGYNHSDVPPFGSRFRLRSDFDVPSTNPYVKTLVTQLKQYGLILADIGGQWDIDTSDVDLYFDPEIHAAFKEVTKLVPPSAFEVVDESGLMSNAKSGDTPVDAETVVARDKSSGETRTMRVVLVGVTIGAETQYLVMQAGAPPHKIQTWVNGSGNKAIHWKMNPALGSLSSDGVYTAPAHLSARQELMLTAVADAGAVTSIKLTLLPDGPIRMDNGSATPLTDSKGHVWESDCCTPYAVPYDYSNFPWPNSQDIKLYKDDTVSWNDIPYRFYMPPGKYRITAKIAEPSNTSPNMRKIDLESQGQLIYRDIDLFAQAGVRTPVDFDLPAIVGSDGLLDFKVRHVRGEQSLLGAMEITPDPGTPRLQIWPSDAGAIEISHSKQFHVIAWSIDGKAVTWSISPQLGSIDAQGLYKAPTTPVSQDTLVTVHATASGLSAQSAITIKKGIPVIRVSCGGVAFTDSQGHAWSGDYAFEGGTTYDGSLPIKGAPADMQKLYQHSRYGYGTDSFRYTFSLPNGTYKVTLKWAEYRTAADVAAQHMAYKMSVKINGKQVLNHFDPIAAAGGVATAYDQTFPASVTKGLLQIVFEGQPGAGYVGSEINGIEIVPNL